MLALVLLFLGYSGLAISLWPMIVPPTLTLRAAAAPPESMGFALVGALFIIPFILAYTPRGRIPLMSKSPADRQPAEVAKPSLASRLGWLVLIWGASIAALAVVALVLRLLMGLVGLTA